MHAMKVRCIALSPSHTGRVLRCRFANKAKTRQAPDAAAMRDRQDDGGTITRAHVCSILTTAITGWSTAGAPRRPFENIAADAVTGCARHHWAERIKLCRIAFCLDDKRRSRFGAVAWHGKNSRPSRKGIQLRRQTIGGKHRVARLEPARVGIHGNAFHGRQGSLIWRTGRRLRRLARRQQSHGGRKQNGTADGKEDH